MLVEVVDIPQAYLRNGAIATQINGDYSCAPVIEKEIVAGGCVCGASLVVSSLTDGCIIQKRGSSIVLAYGTISV